MAARQPVTLEQDTEVGEYLSLNALYLCPVLIVTGVCAPDQVREELANAIL